MRSKQYKVRGQGKIITVTANSSKDAVYRAKAFTRFKKGKLEPLDSKYGPCYEVETEDGRAHGRYRIDMIYVEDLWKELG